VKNIGAAPVSLSQNEGADSNLEARDKGLAGKRSGFLPIGAREAFNCRFPIRHPDRLVETPIITPATVLKPLDGRESIKDLRIQMHQSCSAIPVNSEIHRN